MDRIVAIAIGITMAYVAVMFVAILVAILLIPAGRHDSGCFRQRASDLLMDISGAMAAGLLIAAVILMGFGGVMLVLGHIR